MGSPQKRLGQFFTPPEVARTLVRWVVNSPRQRLIDPACGDGEFLRCHSKSVGIDVDGGHAQEARNRAPGALVHEGDFFQWAARTRERFEAAAGNPPFIRYQHFAGERRERALTEAARMGAHFNGLCSSWAPFLVVTARLLEPGGAMAFVVPAEIGHATYAEPLLESLCGHFESVHVIAFQEKVFPELSEDCWFLHCRGFGGNTNEIWLTLRERFVTSDAAPRATRRVSLESWRRSGCRLRKFLLPEPAVALYDQLCGMPGIWRFSAIGHAGIGYVTGANDFFHLTPTEAQFWRLPPEVLSVSVRKAEQLPEGRVDEKIVRGWICNDEPVLLLNLRGVDPLPASVKAYLDTSAGRLARESYKCRNRKPWYVVPDVKVPDAFLSYMSGISPNLVSNGARCVCTNSVHAVRLTNGFQIEDVQRAWNTPFCQLSCEIEGHPLGGGLLKLEPGEAGNVRVPLDEPRMSSADADTIESALRQARRWRHYA
ncbi:MAG: SAM-dependent methyltransferase [Verrucomicrobia bacterium]|nr:MAG: SAM-dependent methyltransferase [Verrucomicrobiota bacterium]